MVMDSKGTRGRDWGTFLAAARRSPRGVGTIVPSGRALAERLAAVLPRTPGHGRPRVVVELGAGAGAVTSALVAHAAPGTVLLAIEKDAGLADALRAACPARADVTVEVLTADAADLPALLGERDLPGVDALVSVLPWALLATHDQRALLDTLVGTLHPDGVFTAAAYLSGLWAPAARHFHGLLGETFHEVLTTAPMWRHLPPALTYACRQPRR